MYGLDANVALPPFSAIISILLLIGSDCLGYEFIRYFLKQDTIEVRWMRLQAPIVGASILSIVTFPMALFGAANRVNLQILAILLIVAACIHMARRCSVNCHKLKYSWSYIKLNIISLDLITLTMLLLVVGYLLFALSPVTSADSLDYHMGVAIEILNTGIIFNTPEWFHSRLSGNGEVLNALGLSVGAEQFGALLQFAGLIAISAIILLSEGGNAKLNRLLAHLVLSTPVFIFLIGSSKFQLLPIAINVLAFSLVVLPSQRNLNRNEQIKVFFLVCLLVMVSSQAKLNYLLSGGIVGMIALLIMFRKKLLLQAIFMGGIAAAIVLFPVIFIKSDLYGVGYVEAFLFPLPGSFPGIELFENSIRSGRDSAILFPFSLVIPSGIGTITTIIGLGVFSFLFVNVKGDKWIKMIIIAAIVVFVLTLALGPKSSRSYLEPYLWVLLSLSLQKEVSFIGWRMSSGKPVILAQSAAVIVLSWFAAVTIFPGSLSAFWRDQVMTNSANGYAVMKWVDETLPLNASLLTTHRSMALVPRKAMSLDWLSYVNHEKTDVALYLNRIKDEEISHILVMGDLSESKEYKMFHDCLGDEVYGPGSGFVATRNPYNVGLRYDAWLFDIDAKKLPGCFMAYGNT